MNETSKAFKNYPKGSFFLKLTNNQTTLFGVEIISAVPLLSFRLREKMPMSPADPSTPSTCRGDNVNQLIRYQ